MKTAIVYDRVNKWGGAERVLLELHKIFPGAPLYTSVYDEKNALWAKVFPKIYTSFLQKLPFAKGNHEFLANFMPLAFESFNFDEYDLVISVTSESAKGVITKPGTLHVCYCLTPTRYLWSGYKDYFKNPILKFISQPFVNYLRIWDKIAAQRPDKMISISTEVNNRITQYYHRKSEIIFPPLTNFAKKTTTTKKDYYLMVGRIVKYKKFDLVVKTFNKLKRPLYIVGSGSQKWKLKLIARSNIRFFDEVTDDKLTELYQQAKALIMPQVEDYGLISIEAQSLGTPVIAYNKGGTVDTVVDNVTGILFDHQSVDGLTSAIEKFEKMSFNGKLLGDNAKKSTKEVFKRRLQDTFVRTIGSRRRRNASLASL